VRRVKVLLFASLKDRNGGRNLIEIDLPEDGTVRDLKDQVARTIPDLREAVRIVLVAVDHEYAADDAIIPSGAEIAMFPPVSGGAIDDSPTIFEITEKQLDLDNLLRRITLPSTGAAAIFSGMVRATTQSGHGSPLETVYLEYEAYRSMAEAKMRQIADEIRQKWPDVEGIAIVQRVGRLYPGTPTVLIACTAAHRDTGVFEAARYGIDRLKAIVPVWKKEVSPDGEEWIEGEYVPKAGE
jgi:molybdopterin converting factor subunit 1